MRTAYDLTPYYRTLIGLDRMVPLIDAAMNGAAEGLGPPYDIEKLDADSYRITVPVAGFRPSQIEVQAEPNLLTIEGRESQDRQDARYLHRGIALQPFSLRFGLADHIVVQSAHHADGLLTIGLSRQVPEALRPRRIAIATAKADRVRGPAARQAA